MDRIRWRGLGRFVAYSVATVIPVVWLGLVLSQTFAEEVDSAVLREGESQSRAIVESAIEPFLSGQQLNAGLSDREREMFALTTGNLLRQDRVLAIRVLGLNGHTVFDAERPDSTDESSSSHTEALDAMAEGWVSKVVTVNRIGDSANSVGTPAIVSLIAVHSADRPTEVIGVVEVAVPYEQIAAQRKASFDRLRFSVVVGLAAVWLVLGVILATVARRIRRHSKRTEFMALHDALTGLPNRALHADRVSAALASAGRLGTDVALVVVDLDRFKEVNDTLGHRNGDEFLRIVAERLIAAVRPGDTVARLGGDEFGIVLPGATAESVEGILRRLQDALGQEAELAGVAVSAEASMGYAMWPEDADTPEALLRRADLALYAAKTARAAIVRYHPGIDEFDPQRLGLIAELRRAISSGELVLHYQPKVDANSGQVVAFEALVRWMHPVRGLVPPNDFIPIAESTGLIGPLTQWVVDSALAQLAEWSLVRPGLSIAVNISARNLRDDLPGWILNRLAANRVKASQLVLELTETSFATDPIRATALLEELSAAGVRVSLDDFGQGYTSLGSLGHLPVSELKIDRGFVVAMEHSAEDRAIVASVIELGHQLGLTVVAEGVETEEVFADLRRLGCDTMQGYLFSRPVPANEALALMDRPFVTA